MNFGIRRTKIILGKTCIIYNYQTNSINTEEKTIKKWKAQKFNGKRKV